MEAEDDAKAADGADVAAEAATAPEGACDEAPGEDPSEAGVERDEVSRLRAANEPVLLPADIGGLSNRGMMRLWRFFVDWKSATITITV